MAEEGKSNFWARLLIILYALGVVIVGAYQIQHKHGGIFKYLSRESTAFAGSLIRKKDGVLNTLRVEEPVSSGLEEPHSNEEKPPVKSLDKLTPVDRRQLDKLINNL